MRLLPSLAVSFILLTPVFSATAWIGLNVTLDTSTCVAPKAYETCYADAIAATVACNAHTITALGKEACGCVDAALQIQCFAQACWNKVYSCEYQTLVYDYFQCDIAAEPVPFWPAPDNAPGGCSCNAGLILRNALVASSHAITCLQNATSLALTNPTQSIVLDGSCECCMESVVFSSFFDICPDTDPDILGLANLESIVAPYFPWPKCGSSLAAYDCINDLKFIAPTQFSTTGALYGPSHMPTSTGTLKPSNVVGQVSSPPSGSSFLWSAVGSQFTILAVAPEKGGAVVTGTTKVGIGSVTTPTVGSGSAATTSGSGETSASASASSGVVSNSAAATTFQVEYSMAILFSVACFLLG